MTVYKAIYRKGILFKRCMVAINRDDFKRGKRLPDGLGGVYYIRGKAK